MVPFKQISGAKRARKNPKQTNIAPLEISFQAVEGQHKAIGIHFQAHGMLLIPTKGYGAYRAWNPLRSRVQILWQGTYRVTNLLKCQRKDVGVQLVYGKRFLHLCRIILGRIEIAVGKVCSDPRVTYTKMLRSHWLKWRKIQISKIWRTRLFDASGAFLVDLAQRPPSVEWTGCSAPFVTVVNSAVVQGLSDVAQHKTPPNYLVYVQCQRIVVGEFKILTFTRRA